MQSDNLCCCLGQPDLSCTARWSAPWAVWELRHICMTVNCLRSTAAVTPADTAHKRILAGSLASSACMPSAQSQLRGTAR